MLIVDEEGFLREFEADGDVAADGEGILDVARDYVGLAYAALA